MSLQTKFLVGVISFVFLCFGIDSNNKIPIGEFTGSRHYEGFNLKIKNNGMFEQRSHGCTWNYLAKGNCRFQNDSIWLTANRFYHLNNRHRRLTDKGKVINNKFKEFSRLAVINNDILIQLYTDQKGKVWRTIQLHRKK